MDEWRWVYVWLLVHTAGIISVVAPWIQHLADAFGIQLYLQVCVCACMCVHVHACEWRDVFRILLRLRPRRVLSWRRLCPMSAYVCVCMCMRVRACTCASMCMCVCMCVC
jgi:hypothetical protein